MKKWKDLNLFQKTFGVRGYGLLLLIVVILLLIEVIWN